MNNYDNNEEEPRDYRDRSRSPARDDHGNGDRRNRSASPQRDRSERPPAVPEEDEEMARNTGSNLFVTGIHPSLTEEDVTRLFEKYGSVEKCNILRDPHTKDSRGFGFVNMVSSEEADAAKEGLQGEVYVGRTLSIEKARRSKPRTPTPGKYYGPPKRDDFRGGAPRGRFGGDRGFDRRGGYDRRDDHYRSRDSRYAGGDRYDRPSYPRGGRDRYDERGGSDRYYRDDRYDRGSSRRDDYYDRERAPAGRDAYAEPAGGKDGGRSYDDRGDDRYSRR